MSRRAVAPWILAIGSLAAVAAAAGVLHARDTHAPLPVSEQRLLYLRSGAAADRIFLSFDALAADVYWIRTIQHYGRDRRSPRVDGRFELLQPMLDLTTTLDPHFNIAYRFGAVFLSMEPPQGPGRPDQAIALLEKGLAHNPARWQYAHDIAYVHYWYTGRYVEAADWFERAADMPDAPNWLRPLAALTRARGGDRQGARQILEEMVTSGEGFVRAAAERGLAQLDAVDAIDQLTTVIERFRERHGRLPRDWREVVRAQLLPGVPVDSSGATFAYTPDTGLVSLDPSSDLLPLPPGLDRR